MVRKTLTDQSESIRLSYKEANVIELALAFLTNELAYGSDLSYHFTYNASDIQRLSTWIHQCDLKRRLYFDIDAELSWPILEKKDLCLLLLAIKRGVTLAFIEFFALEEANLEKEMADDYQEIYQDDHPIFDLSRRVLELKHRYLTLLQYKKAVLKKLKQNIF